MPMQRCLPVHEGQVPTPCSRHITRPARTLTVCLICLMQSEQHEEACWGGRIVCGACGVRQCANLKFARFQTCSTLASCTNTGDMVVELTFTCCCRSYLHQAPSLRSTARPHSTPPALPGCAMARWQPQVGHMVGHKTLSFRDGSREATPPFCTPAPHATLVCRPALRL